VASPPVGRVGGGPPVVAPPRLRCRRCHTPATGPRQNSCPACGGRIVVFRDAHPPAGRLPEQAGAAGIWRYAPLLMPVRDSSRVSLGEGGTPLLAAARLGARLGLPRLRLKDESQNPSGSFKDRGLAVGASIAVDHGLAGLMAASTGNAAASTAAYAARAGKPSVVLVPEGTPAAKMAHARACGARVIAVRGTYSDAHALAGSAADQLGWLNTTSTFVCPFTVEGARTVAFELGPEVTPDWIAVPIGAGPLLVAIAEGYAELRQLGLATRTPRLLAVQAAGCAPIVRALRHPGARVQPWDSPRSVASGLADPLVGYPEQGDETVAAVRGSGGAGVAVEDADILAAVRMLAADEGLFQEPAGAVAVAGVQRARQEGIIGPGDHVVACLTGTGLKDPLAAMEQEAFPVIPADAEALAAALAPLTRG
jgi:threonine synthase